MAPLKVGDKFPERVKFEWAPITNGDPTSCGKPQEYDASKEFHGKTVALVAVPGAFTPGCQARHLPPYIEKRKELKEKGVDLIVVIAYNDSWVMNAWGKVNKITSSEDILFMSDSKLDFGKNYGWLAGTERLGRFALVIGKDGTVKYVGNEENPSQVTVSGAEEVLAKLESGKVGRE